MRRVLKKQSNGIYSMGEDNKVANHFNSIAIEYDRYKTKNWYYYSQIKKLLHTFIPSNKVVLEIGCGTGDLISFVRPKRGIGIDVSRKMIRIAQAKHPESYLKFIASGITDFTSSVKFDYIFMVDVIEHIMDLNSAFKSIGKLMNKNTIFLNVMANPKWEMILLFAEKLRLKMPEGPHSRLSFEKIETVCKRSGISVKLHNRMTLIPVYIPVVTDFVNKYLEPIFNKYGVNEYFLAKKV